jgi:hypothetical protein
MLKFLSSTREGGILRIEGYPSAIALKRIEGKHVLRLHAMTLHHGDLFRCSEALKVLSADTNAEHSVTRDCIWIAAIALYFKCFGGSKARGQLDARGVFKTQPGALPVFQYFDSLRNKHVLHDENAYTQSLVGIVINPTGSEYKVADVISMGINAVTVDQAHVSSFSELVRATLDWVIVERDKLHTALAAEYESRSRDALLALPNVTFTAPTVEQVVSTR